MPSRAPSRGQKYFLPRSPRGQILLRESSNNPFSLFEFSPPYRALIPSTRGKKWEEGENPDRSSAPASAPPPPPPPRAPPRAPPPPPPFRPPPPPPLPRRGASSSGASGAMARPGSSGPASPPSPPSHRLIFACGWHDGRVEGVGGTRFGRNLRRRPATARPESVTNWRGQRSDRGDSIALREHASVVRSTRPRHQIPGATYPPRTPTS